MRTFGIGLLLWLISSAASAAWQLDNTRSHVSFVTIKKGDVAEVHGFKQVSGTLSDAGEVRVALDLAGVDTKIPVRDERMREVLFETARFPQAVFNANLNMAGLLALPAGGTLMEVFEGQLDLHGVKKTLQGEIAVTRLDGNTLLAVSRQPLVVNAQDFKLGEGVEKLREIAGLPSISGAVPVSFMLVFQAAE